MSESEDPPETGAPIECRVTDSFTPWFADLPGTIAVTTYQAGKLAFIGWRGHQPTLLMREFEKPMGLAVAPGRLALATRNEITFLANAPLLAHEYLIDQPGRYDALYLPRASYDTGDLNVHDVGFAGDDLWFVATRFSCLAGLSRTYCFEPRWKPPFVSELVPEDRCHLNGLAIVDNRPKYVTALGETDFVGGWRENKATGGILMDVETGDILLRGLSMPHSPRWSQGRLWLLNSGAGELLCYDPSQQEARTVAVLPAYLRGLCIIGQFAIVGMSQIREKHIFGGLPVQTKFEKLLSGLAVIDLSSGRTVGMFEFTAGCTEIFDVQFLPGIRQPMVLNRKDDATREAFPAPAFSYWLRPSNLISVP
jgi:uncharacterized protein (TIGR03032 family)